MNVTKKNEISTQEFDWGKLEWYVTGNSIDSAEMTVGKCIIKVGCTNYTHSHPNCQEVLHVTKGTIEHSYGEESVILEQGDTILLPVDLKHNAKNIGDEVAEMFITFSSGDRKSETRE